MLTDERIEEIKANHTYSSKDFDAHRFARDIEAEVAAQAKNCPYCDGTGARRATVTVKTAPVGPTNFEYFGVPIETDEEFAARAGRQVADDES